MYHKTAEKLPILMGFLLIFILASGCNPKQLFTEQNRQHLKEQLLDVSEVQFFLDKEIIMRRQSEKHSTAISTTGEITQRDGQTTQEVRFVRGISGIVEKLDDEFIYVRFEPGIPEDGKFLRFYKNSYDTYQVDADHWYENEGMVVYGMDTFFMAPPHNDALLMCKKSEIYKPEKKSRTVKGMRIEDRKKKKEKRQKRVKRKDYKQVDPNDDSDEDVWEDDGESTEQ